MFHPSLRTSEFLRYFPGNAFNCGRKWSELEAPKEGIVYDFISGEVQTNVYSP